MKRWIEICCVALSLAAATGAQAKALTGGKAGSIEGLVRDLSCPLQNAAATTTAFNLECAVSCAKQNSLLVIQTRDGHFYVPISGELPDRDQNPRLMPFVGKFVSANGRLLERGGARAIVLGDLHGIAAPAGINSKADSNAPDTVGDGKPGVVKGTVAVLACVLGGEGSRGGGAKADAECASAHGNAALVIQSDDGKAYFPISDVMPDVDQRPRLGPYVGKRVSAKGPLYHRDGTYAIAVDEIKEAGK